MDGTASTSTTSVAGSGARKRQRRKPKKLAPLTDAVQPPQGGKKRIKAKRDLREAVRMLAPRYDKLAYDASVIRRGVSVAHMSTSNLDAGGVSQQIGLVEAGVNMSVRRCNDLKLLNDRKAKNLKMKLDELQQVKLEYEGLAAMKEAETEESRRIEELTKLIEEAKLYSEKQVHQRRQLMHALQRLQRNQVKFDAHMNGMEDTQKSVEAEHTEVRLLVRQLEAGLDSAQRQLELTQREVADNREQQEKILHARRLETANARRIEGWRDNRESTKKQLTQEMAGSLSAEEHELLRSQLENKEAETKELQAATEARQRKAQEMEEAFMEVKQITGVSSLEDIVEKFSGQRTTRQSLQKEKMEVESRLAEAKEDKEQLERKFQQVKTEMRGGETELNREIVNSLNEEIAEHRAGAKLHSSAVERVTGLLVSLRQGAQGLVQRIKPYLDTFDQDEPVLTGDDVFDTMEHLTVGEQVLSKMLEMMGGGGGGGDTSPSRIGLMTASDEGDSMDDGASRVTDQGSVGSGGEIPTMAHNVRVISKTQLHEDDYAEAEEEVAEEVRPTKAKDNQVAEELPSRVVLKESSIQKHMEGHRKAEQSARRKRQEEAARAEAADKDSAVRMLLSRKRAQEEEARRLAQHHGHSTLPPGLTLRDDAMTRTSAFLTQTPDLT